MDWQIASRLAHSALDRGFALAPNDPRLLTVQGLVLGLLDLDRQGGEASLRASLASDPLDPAAYRNYQGLGSLALARGDLGEAVDNYRRALRIYDADASIYWFLGAALLFSGENDEAIRVADAGLQLIDEGGGARANLLSVKVSAYSALGQTAQASAALDGAVASVGPEWQPALILPFASAGRMVEAKQLFAQLEATKHPPLEFLVEVVAAADFDRERTFALIHEAINRHISLVANTLRSNTVYAQLRKDPRWAEVMTHLEAEEAKGSDGQNRASPSA